MIKQTVVFLVRSTLVVEHVTMSQLASDLWLVGVIGVSLLWRLPIPAGAFFQVLEADTSSAVTDIDGLSEGHLSESRQKIDCGRCCPSQSTDPFE